MFKLDICYFIFIPRSKNAKYSTGLCFAAGKPDWTEDFTFLREFNSVNIA